MHIAMVLRQFSPHGGLELYAFQLVKGLLERGKQVTVVCESDDTQYQHENLRVVLFAKPAKKLGKAQKIAFYYTSANQALASAGSFDIVHSQHFPIKDADAVTFHNHTVFRLSEVGQAWEKSLNDFKVHYTKAYQSRDKFDRELCHRARCLIFPATVCAEDFKKHYGLSDKVIAIAHPGARLATDQINHPSASAQTDTFNFLFVGKGYRKKGLDILLTACSLVKQSAPNFRLQIAGLRAKPIDKVRLAMLGLSSHVQYLGFQKDMNAVYEKARSIILPSRIEPFGMAPIQGMLHGLVPIVSQVCGVAETLTDQRDALILRDHLSAVELSQHMLRLIKEPDLWSRMSRECMQTSTKLTWDATVEQTLAAYEKVNQSRP